MRWRNRGAITHSCHPPSISRWSSDNNVPFDNVMLKNMTCVPGTKWTCSCGRSWTVTITRPNSFMGAGWSEYAWRPDGWKFE